MNRDDVISGLEKCAASECNEKCPYNGINYGCRPQLMLDAVRLLKEQEPILVKYTTSTIRCPKCNKQITNRGALHNDINYYWKCGQALKWE